MDVGTSCFAVTPLTPERWPAILRISSVPKGPCYGCWCNHFRMPQKQRMPLLGEGARRLFEERVRKGPPPGVIAYADATCVGWLQVGPRAISPNGTIRAAPRRRCPTRRREDERNWAASCFFVRKGFRGKGVTAALLAARSVSRATAARG